MIDVGVIGLGMMGSTHLDVYKGCDDVQVIAVADKDHKLLSGERKACGNIEGQSQSGFSFDGVKQYDEGMNLIADTDIELVDICLPTPLHLEYASAALNAGKHVLIEKPLARTAAEARQLADLAERAKGLSMPAMCMRFWPGWDWLKHTIDSQRYGKVLAAHFRRVASHPGGPFYLDGEQCGGALLDLHVHDTDFVHYCFGIPRAVFSRGYTKLTDEPDHVITQYLYDEGPMVYAEGGWAMADGFGFQMQYTVNFDKATAVFDLAARDPLRLFEPGKKPSSICLKPGMGYQHEIVYFLDCIRSGRAPSTVTVRDAAESVRIIQAERESIHTGDLIEV